MHKRQQFITQEYYKKQIELIDSTPEYWANRRMMSDSPEEGLALRAKHFKSATFDGLLLAYTAGEPLELLMPRLERLISDYERLQHALATYEDMKDISPLAISQWPGDCEECMQVISLCILLHRNDLLLRFVTLTDAAGYRGTDTLYEDLLTRVLPDRVDVDEWHYDIYTPLIKAIYAPTRQESSELLQQYCKAWYPSFADAQTTWHDSHLDINGDEGSYMGYWAFEAAAIAYLYDIDDSQIDHMVYPKDLVAYARAQASRPQSPDPVHTGQA